MKASTKYIALLMSAWMLFLTSCSSRPVENVNSNTQSFNQYDYNDQSANQGNYIDASFINDTARVKIATGDNGDIYLADEYKIYILDSKGNEKKQIVNEKQYYYKLLAAYNDGFFAYDYKREIEEYSVDGTLKKKYDLLSTEQYRQYSIEKILYMDGKLFLMYYRGDNEEDKYLAEYNLKDEELNEIDIEHVRDFVEYRENMLLVFLKQDCCKGHMLTYNIRNGKKSDEIHIPNLPSFWYSYYSSSKECLYLLFQGI